MRASAPLLLPILRSRAQAEILAVVLGNPSARFSLTELAAIAGTSAATVGREVVRAEQAGLVQIHGIGRTKLVSADTSSDYFEPLARLLLVGFGPRRLLEEKLAGLPGIEEAYLFGSWAARYSGDEGPAPRDVNVLIIGSPDRTAVYAAVEAVETELRRPIQVTFRTAEQWEKGSDPFLVTVRSRPLVLLTGAESDSP